MLFYLQIYTVVTSWIFLQNSVHEICILCAFHSYYICRKYVVVIVSVEIVVDEDGL